MKTPKLNSLPSYVPTPAEQIKNLRMHLQMPWKEEAKAAARVELARLLALYPDQN